MIEPFNELTPAQAERLDILAEEAAEVICAVSKIKRHGYNSYHPDGGDSNRVSVATEIGHFLNAMDMLVKSNDIDGKYIESCRAGKAATIAQWLHHQNDENV